MLNVCLIILNNIEQDTFKWSQTLHLHELQPELAVSPKKLMSSAEHEGGPARGKVMSHGTNKLHSPFLANSIYSSDPISETSINSCETQINSCKP